MDAVSPARTAKCDEVGRRIGNGRAAVCTAKKPSNGQSGTVRFSAGLVPMVPVLLLIAEQELLLDPLSAASEMQLRGCGQGWATPLWQQQASSDAVPLILHVQSVVAHERPSVIRMRSKRRMTLCSHRACCHTLTRSGISARSRLPLVPRAHR